MYIYALSAECKVYCVIHSWHIKQHPPEDFYQQFCDSVVSTGKLFVELVLCLSHRHAELSLLMMSAVWFWLCLRKTVATPFLETVVQEIFLSIENLFSSNLLGMQPYFNLEFLL